MKERIMPYNGNDPYIFVTCERLDFKRIIQIISWLNKDDFRVWFSDEDGNATNNIEHLNEAGCVVTFLSQNSIEKGLLEIEWAKNNKKPTLIVCLDDIHMPDYYCSDYVKIIKNCQYKNEKEIFAYIAEFAILNNCNNQFLINHNILLEYNGNAESVVVPKGVTAIGVAAFIGNKKIEEVYLPDGIAHLSDGCFCGCKRLRKINLPKSVIYIGADAFFDCENLECIDLPKSVETIGERAFGFCSKIRSLTIPSALLALSPTTFHGCSSLELKIDDSSDAFFFITDGCLFDITGQILFFTPENKSDN